MKNNQSQPDIVAKQSMQKNLDAGVHMICSCGFSLDGIFCDGSHQSTAFKPKRLLLEEPTSVAICMCKHSQNFPYCDGFHRKLAR